MQLSGSEEDILREYQATSVHHHFYPSLAKGQILLESKYLPLAKHLQAESLSTLSQGNSPISQVNNILKPPSSDRTQLRYGGCQSGDYSSQVNCVFELYHDDDDPNGNNNQVQPEEVFVPNPNEICYDQPMSYNNASMRIRDNNTTQKLSNSQTIEVSPNNTYSSHRNNNNNIQLDIKQSIQDEYPSKYLYNTILSGISNGTGTIPQNIFQPIPEQHECKAIQKDERTLNMISNNQPPNYSEILNASVYSMYLQENNKNKSADQQSNRCFNRFSESSRIGNNSKNQVSHQPMNSRDSKKSTNAHYNSNNYSAAEALTQASLQSRNYPMNEFNQSQQDRVKLINQEALGEKSKQNSDKKLQNTTLKYEYQTSQRGRNKSQDQKHQYQDQQQKDQVQQQVNCVVQTNNQRADLSQLIDGFNLQSRIKINGIKAYERRHWHARFFQREIPLSLEDEQSFYLETSTKKYKEEFTKQVISPSTDIANNRQFFNKENYDNSNVQKQKEQQLASQQPNKEMVTFEANQYSGAKEDKIDQQKDKNSFSPCCKSSGRKSGEEEEQKKSTFSFQKNESTAFQKQFYCAQSQQQMSKDTKNSSRSNRTKRSTLLHNNSISSFYYRKDNQRKQKSQQHSQLEENQHQTILESSKLLKEKKSSRKNLRNSQDAATQVSILHSRDLSSRNAQGRQSYQSSRQSPVMDVQGLVHDLSQPSATSEQGNSQQNSTALVNWSSSRNKGNSSSNERLGQVSQQQQKQQEILKQVASFRSYSSIRNRLLNNNADSEKVNYLEIDKDQQQQRNPQKRNGKENCFKTTNKVRDNCLKIMEQKDEEDSSEKILFRNQVLQEQTGKLLLKKAQNKSSPDVQKPQKQLRNNSCYSVDAYEYQGYLQPKRCESRKDQRKQDIMSASQQSLDVNPLGEKRITKIKVISNKSRIESNNTAEASSKKSGNIKKNKHKIIQQDKASADQKHIPKESKQSVVIPAATPAVDPIKNNQKSSPCKSNVTRIRSQSLIDKIQDKAISKNKITHLIQNHASCCRNFRKELQTSFYNN